MDDIKKDNRFSHISKDPRFRKMRRNERKVQIDSRFKGMFNDKQFKLKYTVDKRGRPIKATTNEDLKRFYELGSEDESSESSDSDEEETTKQKKKKEKKKIKGNKAEKADKTEIKKKVSEKTIKKKAEKKDVTEKKLNKDKSNVMKKNDLTASTKTTKAKCKKPSQSRNETEKINEDDDSDEADDESDEQGEEDEESDSGEQEEEEVDEEGSEEDSDDEEGSDLDITNGPDYARGEGLVSSSSEEEDEEDDDDEEAESKQNGDHKDSDSEPDASSSSSDESVEHNWGEVNQEEAVEVEEATSRLAVCNMDWDRIKAQDLMVLLNSFKTPAGTIKSIKIYPSEYGLKRMQEEEERGPSELVEAARKIKKIQKKGKEEDKEDEGSVYHREKLRVYQMNRLKYYYAVVECDSVQTADNIYKECDNMEYESSATRMDLRFIPEDMTFDDLPKSVATDVPDAATYKPTLFKNAAMQQSKVELTWDETDPDRVKLTMRKFDKDNIDDMNLNDYLASESEGEQDAVDPYGGLEDPDLSDAEELEDEEAQILKIKQLVQGMKDDDDGKDDKDMDMEITWEPGLMEPSKEKEKQATDNLTPWEQYLKKKGDKKKVKRAEFKKKRRQEGGDGGSEEEDDEEESGLEDSEDDIPEGIDMDDPYFKEELEKMEGPQSKGKKKSDKKSSKSGKKWEKEKKLTPEEEEDKRKREAELSLMLMDEDDQKQHFSLKALQEEQQAEDSTLSRRKKRKIKLKQMRKAKEDAKQVQDTFELDTGDSRFKELFENPLYNIDPSASEFKKTKGTEMLIDEKIKRRKQPKTKKTNSSSKDNTGQKRSQDAEHIDTSKLKRTKLDSASPKKDAGLASLVKSVKSKAKLMEMKKKKS